MRYEIEKLNKYQQKYKQKNLYSYLWRTMYFNLVNTVQTELITYFANDYNTNWINAVNY